MSRAPTARTKVLTRTAVARRVAGARRRREKVVLTSGCFDLLHVGHLRAFEQARALGDRLVVGVNADSTVRKLKGAGRPLVPARQRAEVIAGLACVDWVVVFGGATPRALIRAIDPDVFAKGGDWPLAVLRAQDAPADWNGEIVRLRQIPGVRTTRIVERARGDGRPKRAAAGARRSR